MIKKKNFESKILFVILIFTAISFVTKIFPTIFGSRHFAIIEEEIFLELFG